MPPPRLKRSNTANATPASLEDGEIAINQADGRLYYRTAAGGVGSIAGGGSYTLPTATSSVLGGVRIGSGLSIANGLLSAASAPAAIIEATTAAGFPGTGSSQTLYVSRDTSRVYRWDSSGVYIEIGN
jgi:hypothetical protein